MKKIIKIAKEQWGLGLTRKLKLTYTLSCFAIYSLVSTAYLIMTQRRITPPAASSDL